MYQGIAYDLDEVMVIATDPDLGLFSSVCNILAPDGSFTVGQPSGNYVPVSGLQGIACMKATLSAIRISATEAKTMQDQQQISPFHTLLDSYYPALWAADGTPHTEYQAQITDEDGTVSTFDILGIEKDSQGIMTRLAMRLVTL